MIFFEATGWLVGGKLYWWTEGEVLKLQDLQLYRRM